MLVKGVDAGVVHLGYVAFCCAVRRDVWCCVVRLPESRDPPV